MSYETLAPYVRLIPEGFSLGLDRSYVFTVSVDESFPDKTP